MPDKIIHQIQVDGSLSTLQLPSKPHFPPKNLPPMPLCAVTTARPLSPQKHRLLGCLPGMWPMERRILTAKYSLPLHP